MNPIEGRLCSTNQKQAHVDQKNLTVLILIVTERCEWLLGTDVTLDVLSHSSYGC